MLYVGSLRKEKGPFFLLEIAKYMPELNFVIIGGDKRKVQYIKELSLSKGIKNCYVHAYIDYKYVPYCLMEADILIMPYLKTGELIDSMSPLKMFEYLATGKPILASDLSSIRSILVHKVNSFCLRQKILLIVSKRLGKYYLYLLSKLTLFLEMLLIQLNNIPGIKEQKVF